MDSDLPIFEMPQIFVAPYAPTGQHVLSGLARTIRPDGIERTFKPIFNDDGTIRYEKPILEPGLVPDAINGYRRDDTDPYLFHPTWPPCAARFYSAKIKSNGCVDVVMACNHPQATTFRQPVDCGTCHGCVLRTQMMPEIPEVLPVCEQRDFEQPVIQPDGRLVYKKTGWEAPQCPEGYHRDPNDTWAFIPEWQPCVDRTFDNTMKPCGYVTIHAKCNSDTSGFKNQLIPFVACQNCPVRREPSLVSIQL